MDVGFNQVILCKIRSVALHLKLISEPNIPSRIIGILIISTLKGETLM